METAPTPRWAHLRRLALCALGVAFAWIALALALGIGSTPSHAADDEGVLDPLTSTVDGLLGAVTGTVDAVVSPVADLVGGTVEGVAQVLPAPVREPVVEVVDSVGVVTDAVTDVVDAVPVTAVTGAVVDTVTAVPVVGQVVEVLGLDDAVSDLGESVDTTLGSTTTTVDAVVDDVLPAPAATVAPPALPEPGDSEPGPSHELNVAQEPVAVVSGAGDAVAADGASPATSRTLAMWQRDAFAAAWSSFAAGAVGSASDETASDPPGPPDGPCLAPAAPAGAAGSSAATSGALPPSGSLDDHRAWGRSALFGDDAVPASPAGSPDVSPD